MSEQVYSQPAEGQNELFVCQFGEEACQPSHAYGPHVRDHVLIHFVASGNGIFHCGGRVYPVEAGQGFLILPGEETFYQASEHTPWHYAWVNFYGNEADEIFSHMGISTEFPVFTVKNGGEIVEVMRNMPTERSSDIEKNLDFSARLYELMSLLMKNKATSEGGENAYLASAKRYIKSHYFEDITVENISSHIGISRKYLFAIFKKYLGVSPKDYIVSYRMRRAEEFLGDESLSVGNIAYSVGYKDPLTFSKMFKMKTGMSPSEYRRKKNEV